jgi:hypothetical protein
LVGEEYSAPKSGKPMFLSVLKASHTCHLPDKVNFSRPRIATKFSKANHVSCSLLDVVEELSLEL